MNQALLEIVAKKKKLKKDKKLEELKTAYKKGKLKFDSEKIAESILREFKKGFIKP